MSFTTLPTVETFGNNDSTTLSSSMAGSDTTASVVSVEGFPTDGQFRLLIDSELLLVTGYDSGANQWQVTRGAEGTTAASHDNGAQVVCILTRGALLQLKSDAQATGGTNFVYREGVTNPTGNVYATFDEAYKAAFATGVPATIFIDDTLGDGAISPLYSGTSANFTAFDGTLMTLTGLSGVTPDMVGGLMTFSGFSTTANNGVFTITNYLSGTSVQVTNSAAVFPDSNSGAINWCVNVDYNLSQITLSGITPGAYEQPTTIIQINEGVTLNEGLARLTGGLWLLGYFVEQAFFGTLGSVNPYYMRVDNNSLIASDTGGTFDLSQGSSVVYMEIDDGGYILTNGGSAPYFFLGNGAGAPVVNVQIGDASFIDNGFIYGTGGTFNLKVNAISAGLPNSFIFSGTFNLVYNTTASNLQPFAGYGTPTPVAVSPNIVAGTMYFDQATNQPFWYTGSTWVSYPVRSLVQGTLTPNQTTNLTAGDHLMFSQAEFQQGVDISLDVSSAYTTTLGAASIGRITLAAGHTYKLTANISEATGSGSIYYQWVDARTGNPFGNGSRIDDGSVSGNHASFGDAVGFFTVASAPAGLVELRIMFNNGYTQIGENAAASLYPWFTVEEIA